MTLRVIHLHGRLKKQFGASHRFDVATAAEALRALNCAFPGDFVTALQTGSYKLVRGDKRSGMQLDFDLVTSFNLGQADLHLIPVAAGAANNKGIAKTILGTALVGAAIFIVIRPAERRLTARSFWWPVEQPVVSYKPL